MGPQNLGNPDLLMGSNVPALAQKRALSLSSKAVCYTNVLGKDREQRQPQCAFEPPMYRNTRHSESFPNSRKKEWWQSLGIQTCVPSTVFSKKIWGIGLGVIPVGDFQYKIINLFFVSCIGLGLCAFLKDSTLPSPFCLIVRKTLWNYILLQLTKGNTGEGLDLCCLGWN